MSPAEIPDAFLRQAEGFRAAGSPPGAQWARSLPRLLEQSLARWELTREEGTWWGQAALVVAVRRADGTPAALKLGWPHPESRDEHLALRAWDGRRAVRLLAADPRAGVLLLERLDQHSTTSLDPVSEAEQVALLLRDLDRPALPQPEPATAWLRTLLADIDAWDAAHPGAGLPRRLLGEARAAATGLLDSPGVDARLLHSDLHGENVRWRPEPGEWVAIDPKPLAATPALGLAPVLWNRWDATQAAPDPRAHLAARFHTMLDVLDLDPERARAGAVVRLVRNALWDLQDQGPGADVTVPVTVIKALDPS